MLHHPLFAICSTSAAAAAAAVEVASSGAEAVAEIVIETAAEAEVARPFGVEGCSVSFHWLASLDQYYRSEFDPA